LQAAILLRSYQTSAENNPALGQLLNTVSIAAKGELLDISLQLTQEQLLSLIEHNTFVMTM
jgi:hypothetical protein